MLVIWALTVYCNKSLVTIPSAHSKVSADCFLPVLLYVWA